MKTEKIISTAMAMRVRQKDYAKTGSEDARKQANKLALKLDEMIQYYITN